MERIEAGYRIAIVCDQKHPQPGGGAPRRTRIALAEAIGENPSVSARWRLIKAEGLTAHIWSRGRWVSQLQAMWDSVDRPIYTGPRDEKLEALGYTWTDDPWDIFPPNRLTFTCPFRSCNRSVIASDDMFLWDVLDHAALIEKAKRLSLSQLRQGLERVGGRD